MIRFLMLFLAVGVASAQANSYQCNFNTDRGVGMDPVQAHDVIIKLGDSRKKISLPDGTGVIFSFADGDSARVHPANYFKGMNILTVQFHRDTNSLDQIAVMETYVPKRARMFGTNAKDSSGRFISISCHRLK